MRELILEFPSDMPPYNLSFEDTGKVAYAYLKRADEIVGDVWLYNRCDAPDLSEWQDDGNIPFANCIEYIGEGGRMTAEVSENDVLVDWESDESGPVAYIYIFENLYGVIGVNDKPGYARHAIKSGPLAQVMESV